MNKTKLLAIVRSVSTYDQGKVLCVVYLCSHPVREKEKIMTTIRTAIKKAIYFLKLTFNPVCITEEDGTTIKGADIRDVHVKHAHFIMQKHNNIVRVEYPNGDVFTR